MQVLLPIQNHPTIRFPSHADHVFGPRIRRIKCDETRPACVKCTGTGRTCDGYTVKHDATPDPPTGPQLAPVSTQSIPNALSVGIGGSHAERRGFHFFQSYVWPQLSTALNSVFWERLILQTSHADSAIRHAAIAFGSLGERLLINNVMTFDNEDANRLHNFACLQYSKAIKELCEQISSGQERSIKLTLITCFIFICFEFLQGNESAAITHLKSGLEILRRSDFLGIQLNQIHSMCSMESEDFGFHVTLIFAVLDRSAANWIAAPSFGMPTPIITSLDYGPLLSEGFPNIDKATEYLENLITQLHGIRPAWGLVSSDSNTSCKYPSKLTPLLEHLFKTVDDWSNAMDAFMARSRQGLCVQEAKKATTLILHHRVAALKLSASCQASEEDFYRDSEPYFNYIVSMSTPLLRPIDSTIDFRGSDDKGDRHLFSFGSSLVYPLYFTAIHCRNPEIQKEALSLLSTSPWREGAWDSAAMARIAERRIWQREQDLSRNNKRPIDTGPDMAGYDLQHCQYQLGGSFKFPEDRITELRDSDRSL